MKEENRLYIILSMIACLTILSMCYMGVRCQREVEETNRILAKHGYQKVYGKGTIRID